MKREDHMKLIVKAQQKVGNLPFKERGIMITCELIEITMKILNKEPNRTLPQNCRNDIREKTPDGLDRRLKEYYMDHLRRANIISDVLALSGIVDIIQTENPSTGNIVQGTRLRQYWCW